MVRRTPILFGTTTVLAVLCALFAARVASHFRGARVEFGEERIARLSDATRSRLATLDSRVFLTYFVSGRGRMPSSMRHVERDVTDLLDSLRDASAGRLDYQVVDLEADPDLPKYAASHGAAPFRARSVERDAYSETTVWSTLVIAYGSRREVAIAAIGPEHIPRLQGLVVAQLDEMEHPRKPLVAVAAPAGYEKFKAWAAKEADVVAVDVDRGERPPADADLLVWLEPRNGDDDALRLLDDWLSRGRDAVVAGSGRVGQIASADPEPLFRFEERSDGPVARVFSHFGLRRSPELLLDERCMNATIGDRAVPVPFFISCAPVDQDFRTMRSQPNGTLAFSAPAPFVLDAEETAARGFSADVLATSSERSWSVAMPSRPVKPAEIARTTGRSVGKRPLAVRLRPRDPWHGGLVAFAAATPFQDGWFEREDAAHEKLAKTLLDELASSERRVVHRAGILRREPLPALDSGPRALWRALVLGLFPAALAVVALLRGVVVRPSGAAARRGTAQRAAVAAAAVAVALLLARGLDALGLHRDLAEGAPSELAPATRALAAHADVAAELVFTGRAGLPASMRSWPGRVRAVLDELRRAGARVAVREVDPMDLGDAERAALAASGVAPFETTSRDEEVTTVRSVYAALRLEERGRSEVLRFEDAASMESLEFRLACALSRLSTGRRVRIAFCDSTPRLTPAEAHDDMNRGLVSPTGADVFGLARRVLEANDFDVVRVDPRRPAIPAGTDALVCFQPRRDAAPFYESLAAYLHGGGRALVALQHYNMQARQYRGRGFDFVYWPQPQWPETERLWFPEMGIEVVPEVLFDERMTRIDADTQVNRAAGARPEIDRQTSALPFDLRAPAASFSTTSPITRGLGDQAFVWADFLRWDEGKLARLGLRATTLVETSERTWTYAWKGGYLPEELLRGPPKDAEGRPAYRGRLPLAAAFEGIFPLPSSPLGAAPAEPKAKDDPELAEGRRVLKALDEATGESPSQNAPQPATEEKSAAPAAAAPGELVLVGCSEMFKDGRILDPAFRADHLLLNAVAHLALDPGLADVATRRLVARGFEPPQDDVRARWRVGVLAAVPSALVLFGIVRRLLDRRAPATARTSA